MYTFIIRERNIGKSCPDKELNGHPGGDPGMWRQRDYHKEMKWKVHCCFWLFSIVVGMWSAFGICCRWWTWCADMFGWCHKGCSQESNQASQSSIHLWGVWPAIRAYMTWDIWYMLLAAMSWKKLCASLLWTWGVRGLALCHIFIQLWPLYFESLLLLCQSSSAS